MLQDRQQWERDEETRGRLDPILEHWAQAQARRNAEEREEGERRRRSPSPLVVVIPNADNGERQLGQRFDPVAGAGAAVIRGRLPR